MKGGFLGALATQQVWESMVEDTHILLSLQ